MAARFSRSSAESRASVSRDDDSNFARSDVSVESATPSRSSPSERAPFASRTTPTASRRRPRRYNTRARSEAGASGRSSAPRSWSVQTSRARSVNARLASSAAACCALSLADSYAHTARRTETGGERVSVRARSARGGRKGVVRVRRGPRARRVESSRHRSANWQTTDGFQPSARAFVGEARTHPVFRRAPRAPRARLERS